VIEIAEGESVSNVIFRLPDFGTKRNVVFRVVDEDGLPVAGARVSDRGDSRTRLGTSGVTDSNGHTTLALWPNAEYTLKAQMSLLEYRSYFADAIRIPAGAIPANPVFVLRDFHSRRRKGR
jgi:hypothetical protein